MKLETFFEKFDQFADAPGAVAKMRELVLELAVRGLLTERHSMDQADRSWCEFIEEFDHRIYSYDPGPPPPFEIPDEWRWVRLNDAADCRAATKVSPASIKDNDWVLDLEDIEGASGQVVHTATFADRRSLSTKAAFEPGDVLYGKLRPYLNKVVVAAKRGFCTTEIIPLRPAPFLTPEFLRCYLRSQTFLRYAAQKNYGMKMPRLGTKDLESAEIPVPPPAEQKRIVAKVDELMALCDRLEAQQLERKTRHAALARASLSRFADAPTPANLQFLFHPSYAIPPADLRKSILTLAVQGKLVSQDFGDESAVADFNALVRTRETSLLKRTKIDGEATAEEPSIPDSWIGVSLGDLVSIRTGFAFKSGDYAERGTFILRVTNINPDGSFDTSNAVYLPEAKLDEKMQGFLLEEHELLVVMVGGSLGKIGQVTAEILPALLNQNMWRLKPYSDRLDYRFLRLVLHDLNENRLQITTSTHGHLAMGTYAAAKVPFPPLAEQRRIVAKVDQLMALVDELETQLAASRATAAKLLEALVAELTEQEIPQTTLDFVA